MKKEDKELLFKDLSARLPYHVRVKVWLKDGTTEEGVLDLEHNYADVLLDAFYYNKIVDIKPYLRPISSMTLEEEREYNLTKTLSIVDYPTLESFDWLLAHHFDFRGLIGKGLALVAPEGMYHE
jgi:hypothetical protein